MAPLVPEDHLLATLSHVLDQIEALAAAGESPLSDEVGEQLRRAARIDEERRRRATWSASGVKAGHVNTAREAPVSPPPSTLGPLDHPRPGTPPRTSSTRPTPPPVPAAVVVPSLDSLASLDKSCGSTSTHVARSSSTPHCATRHRPDTCPSLGSSDSSSSSSSDDDEDARDPGYVLNRARCASDERDWDEEDEVLQARDELEELDERRRPGTGAQKRPFVVEDGPRDDAKKRAKPQPGINLRRLIREPADGLLLRHSPLAVFANHVYLLGRPTVQRELGALIHALLNPSSTLEPEVAGSSSMPAGLADCFAEGSSDAEPSEVAFAAVVRRLHGVERRSAREDWERVLASMELAALVARMERGSGDGSRLERLQRLARLLPLDAEECMRSVSEGHMWARWLCIGGVPLVLVLVVLLRYPTVLSSKLSFRDVVMRRTKNGALLDEFDPERHPYPLAAPAFHLFLRPTLATIASYGPVVVNFLHHSNVILSGEPVSKQDAKHGHTPYFWRPPRHKTQTRLSPVVDGSIEALVKLTCSNRVLAQTKPLQVVLGRFESPARRPEPFDPSVDPALAPAVSPADAHLRTSPGRPSELALGISAQLDAPNLAAFVHANAVKEVDIIDARLPRITIDAPVAVDLAPEKLGLEPPPPRSAAARDWAAHRPTAFFSPGHERVDRRAGWNDASRTARAQMEREGEASTKASLLRRMEALAGGRASLIKGVSRAVEVGPVITSSAGLERRLKEGWTLGSEMTTLAVDDAIVEIKSDVEGAPPILVAYPPGTIPLYIQHLYERANSVLYPPELSHHLGVICCDSACSTCSAAGVRDGEEEEGLERVRFLPRARAARPEVTVPAELLGVPVGALDIVERPAGKSAQKPPSAKTLRASDGEAWAEGACVMRMAAREREGVFMAWNLCSWPGTKYGERREGVDEETGLKEVGGTGPGNGALWRDQVWTSTLGYAADAAAAQLQPLWAFQRELVRRHQPAIFDKLVTNLSNFDGDGDGDPQWPTPWAGYHANAGGAGASMAMHTDDDALEAAAAIGSFGEYTGGEIVLAEMLAAVQGESGSLNLLASDRVLHGVARVRSGRRLTSDSSQSRAFAVV
ncbi:hypothetical protein JCM8208_002010 [Rhodotorula glutinis]